MIGGGGGGGGGVGHSHQLSIKPQFVLVMWKIGDNTCAIH